MQLVPQQLLIARGGVESLDDQTMRYRGLQDFLATKEIRVRLPQTSKGQSRWQVTAAWPQCQWHSLNLTMRLPIRRDWVHRAVTLKRADGFTFAILVGTVGGRRDSFWGYCRYWIYPWPFPNGASIERSTLLDLSNLCQGAKTFARKD